MPPKFGTTKFGAFTFGDKSKDAPNVKPQTKFTPVKPFFVTPKMTNEISRRHYLALAGGFGQDMILYQRKLNGTHLSYQIEDFDSTSPYKKLIWERGNERIPNANHPDTRRIIVTIDGKRLTQVNNEKSLYGTFSFYVDEATDKTLTLIFCKDFDPSFKKVILEFDTICECADVVSMQPGNPRCQVCYGTLYERGYDRYFNPEFDAGVIKIRQQFSAKALQLQQMGYQVSNSVNFWTIPLPEMKDKDILEIVKGDGAGKRFFIINHNKHQVGGTVTSQWFQLNELTDTDPVYKAKFL